MYCWGKVSGEIEIIHLYEDCGVRKVSCLKFRKDLECIQIIMYHIYNLITWDIQLEEIQELLTRSRCTEKRCLDFF